MFISRGPDTLMMLARIARQLDLIDTLLLTNLGLNYILLMWVKGIVPSSYVLMGM